MRLLLIDGSNLIFRAYYATEKLKIKDRDGNPVNAIHTLISMINKIINKTKPTNIYIALDTKEPTFRHILYPEYKGQRSETPDELRQQFPMVKELYTAMGIKYGSMIGYEADDLIATYAKIAQKKGYEVDILSGDKDLLQLVDKHIKVITPAAGFAKEICYDEAEFMNRYNFLPNRFIEYKAIVGDSSDNIIGVKGIGHKTACKMISEFDSLEQIITYAKSGVDKKKVWTNLAESLEIVSTNKKLVTLVEDIEVNNEISDFSFDTLATEKFVIYLQKMGFSKYYTQFSNQLPIKKVKNNYKVIDYNFNLIKSEYETFIVPIYTNSNNFQEDAKIYLIKNNETFMKTNDITLIRELILADTKKVVYNLKYILSSINLFDYNNIQSDIFLVACLLDKSNFKKGLDGLAFDNNVYKNPELFKEIKKENEVNIQQAGEILNFIEPLYISLQNKLELSKMNNVLYDIELPLSKTCAQMENDGIYIDEILLDKLEQEYEIQIENCLERLATFTKFNYNSSQQLSEYLFETCGLPTKGIKKSINGYSTDVDNLEKLQKNIMNQIIFDEPRQFITILLEYRKLKKIHTTYLLGIKKHIINGKIHPIINQVLTETGRVSIIDPNIQNMPIKSESGKVIRSLFYSGEYKYIVTMDYSQVELRVIAHLANENQMIEDFNNGLDIHKETAKRIFNLKEVSKSQRSKAKAINFGIIYGMSKYGLAKQVGISQNDAEEFINLYFETYPNIKKYMKNQVMYAQKNEYVQTETGRRRQINGINSKNKMTFENAARIAINTPVQGTAADIIKIAMIEIQEYLLDKKDVKMVMQIHDELVFYMNDLKYIKPLKNIMEEVVNYAVKLSVDTSSGKNWLECI